MVSPLIRPMMEGLSRYDRPIHRVYNVLFPEVRRAGSVPSARPENPLPRKFTFADPDQRAGRAGRSLGDVRGEANPRVRFRRRAERHLPQVDAGAVPRAEKVM